MWVNSKKFDLSIDRIDFSYKKNLSYIVEAHTVVDEVLGKAIHYDGENDKEIIAGEITAHQINLAEIINDGWSILNILDEHSHQLSEFSPFFSDNEKIFSNKVFKTLNIKNDELLSGDDDVLILDNLYVEKKFRGKNISELLIEALCNDFRRLGRFAFLKAFPLQFSGSEKFDDLPQEKKEQILKEKEEFKNSSFKVSQEKLIKLYKKCNFKMIDGEKEFMVTDLYDRD